MIRWAQRTSFPGFGGIPLFDVLVFLINEISRDDIITRGNSIAFSFFLALFPSLIFLINILPLMPLEGLEVVIQSYMEPIMPHDAEGFIFTTMESLTKIPRGGALSLGAFFAFFFSSNGMMALMNGFDKTYMTTFKSRGYIRKRLLALLLTVLLGILLLVSGVLIVLGNQILTFLFDWLDLGILTRIGFETLKWLIVISMIYAIVSMIFRFGPALKIRWSFFSPGTTLSVFFIILSSVGFSFFVNNFGTYNKIYGSISAIIVLMVWFQIISLILLIGFELNTSIAINRDLKQERQGEDKIW